MSDARWAAAEAAWHAALVDRLASTPDRALAVAAMAGPAAPGEWSALEVIRHLVAVEELVWQQRLRQLATSAGASGRQLSPPTWEWHEPGPWSGPGDADLDTAVAELRRRRDTTIWMVRALDDGGWQRYGLHATYGRLDVARLLTIAVDHDAEHLGQIAALVRG